jgi:protein-S-isoprenylcysteine O-methyltransferase Ste14
MKTTHLIIFIITTVLIILFSWFVSIREKRYHGIPRFFVFEGLLLLFLIQAKFWFRDPWSIQHIISWILLIASIPYALAAFILFNRHGKHGKNFENTTQLVTTGLYHYIRHPMYASLLFLGWGMFLKDISLIPVIIIIVITLALFLTCKVEEGEMKKKFGEEYRNYMKVTKMWIPYII